MAASNDDGTTEDGWLVYIWGETCISILSVLCMDWTDCTLFHSQLSIKRINRFIKYSSDSSILRTYTVTTISTRETTSSLTSRTMHYADIFVYQMDIINPNLVTVPIYLTERLFPDTGDQHPPPPVETDTRIGHSENSKIDFRFFEKISNYHVCSFIGKIRH